MKTVYKYPFPITDRFILNMPVNARILNAFVQDGIPCLWAEVDTDAPIVEWVFMIIGTGKPMPDFWLSRRHIITFPMPPFVWHLYQIQE